MVKVVGYNDAAVKRMTCKGCAAILEYTPSEVKRIDGHDYSGGSDGIEYVDCPNCGNRAVIRSW